MRQLLVFSVGLLLALSCSTEPGPNPWDDLTNEDSALTGFADIHKNILEPKCANPACRRHFYQISEPSKAVTIPWSTILTKNDEDETYERVVPGDINAS